MTVLRPHAEDLYADELAVLAKSDDRPRPPGWRLSPWAVTTYLLGDDWTVKTDDGSLAAHFEHSFTLTPRGAWILTALDGGEAKLAELGVPFGGR